MAKRHAEMTPEDIAAKRAKQKARYASDAAYRDRCRQRTRAAQAADSGKHRERNRLSKIIAGRDKDKWLRRTLQGAKRRAAASESLFCVTAADVTVPDNCPVFGTPLAWATKDDRWAWPSLDRVDPSKGYVTDNVRVISFLANSLKRDATLAEAHAIVAYMERELEPDQVLHTEGII